MRIVLLVLALVSLSAVADEIYRCGGVISNRPCGSVPVTPLPKNVQKVRDQSRKRLLLHDLTMRADRVEREHDFRMPIARAEEICRKEKSSVEQCAKIVEEITLALEERVDAKRQLAINERKPAQPEATPVERTVIEIIENNVIVRPRRRGDRYDLGYGNRGYGNRGYGNRIIDHGGIPVPEGRRETTRGDRYDGPKHDSKQSDDSPKRPNRGAGVQTIN